MEVKIRVFRAKFNVKVSGEIGLSSAPIKRVTVNAFIIIILVYSAIKNKAKGPAAYSTLNPDTSSDSPSVRSNGARLVSASVEINHIIARGHVGNNSHVNCWVVISVDKVKDPFIRSTERIIIANVTSYEMVCATARRAPIKAYLELEAHPDHKIAYTAKLEVAKINRIPIFILIRGIGIGKGIHMVSASVKARVGAIINSIIDDVRGFIGSLINSFIASANGWSRP